MKAATLPERTAGRPARAWRRLLARATGLFLLLFTRLITGLRASGFTEPTAGRPRVYFANHRSHGDFALVWAAVPEHERARIRPVAGRDYWQRGRLRRFIGEDVFNALLIDRAPRTPKGDPIPEMSAALDAGHALIVFPEGTRNGGDEPLLPFRNGIARFAARRPDVEFVPVWLENLNRVLPKGEVLPVPLLCKASFGPPVRPAPGEDRVAFRERLRTALLALSPSVTDHGDPS